MASKVPPLRTVLLEVADEHATRAAELEAAAMLRAAEGRSFAPPEPRVADLLLEAQHKRKVSEAARHLAEGLRF